MKNVEFVYHPWLRSFPAGFLGMVGLVLLLESLIVGSEERIKNSWFWEWRVNGRAASRAAVKSEVLCFGSSLTHHGIIPKVVKMRSGMTTFNLALTGGQAPTSYFQLRRALRAGARPRAVVVEFFALLMNHGLEENTERWPELLTPRECLELSWTARDSLFFARTMTAWALPSYRVRSSIREAVPRALRGEGTSHLLELAAHQRNWKINQGCEIFAPKEAVDLGDMDRWYEAAFHNPGLCQPCHAVYLRRFLDLAAASGIRVYWLVPPIHPRSQAKFLAGGTERRYDQLLTRVLRNYPNLTVIDGRSAGYVSAVFLDQAHLHRNGAAILSASVGTILRDTLYARHPSSSVVPLPAYAELDNGPELEDLHESLMIVARAKQALQR